jgi:hypothetical protein
VPQQDAKSSRGGHMGCALLAAYVLSRDSRG